VGNRDWLKKIFHVNKTQIHEVDFTFAVSRLPFAISHFPFAVSRFNIPHSPLASAPLSQWGV